MVDKNSIFNLKNAEFLLLRYCRISVHLCISGSSFQTELVPSVCWTSAVPVELLSHIETVFEMHKKFLHLLYLMSFNVISGKSVPIQNHHYSNMTNK